MKTEPIDIHMYRTGFYKQLPTDMKMYADECFVHCGMHVLQNISELDGLANDFISKIGRKYEIIYMP